MKLILKAGCCVQGAKAAGLQGRTVILLHACNTQGKWGAGFVLSLSREWGKPESAYRAWQKTKATFKLGNLLLVPVADGVRVCNALLQETIQERGQPWAKHFSTDAFEKVTKTLAAEFKKSPTPVEIHMPKIGTGLGGAIWEEDVLPVMERAWKKHSIDVYVYTYK